MFHRSAKEQKPVEKQWRKNFNYHHDDYFNMQQWADTTSQRISTPSIEQSPFMLQNAISHCFTTLNWVSMAKSKRGRDTKRPTPNCISLSVEQRTISLRQSLVDLDEIFSAYLHFFCRHQHIFPICLFYMQHVCKVLFVNLIIQCCSTSSILRVESR
jgi:hypothetical protein